jgi:hypothetical protein
MKVIMKRNLVRVFAKSSLELLMLKYVILAAEPVTLAEVPPAAPSPAPETQEGDGEEDTGGPKILSKKEKEKLKKEREKAGVH